MRHLEVSRHLTDRLSRRVIFLCALISFSLLLLIAIFIFREGVPAFQQIGFFNFICGTVWRPGIEEYGILPMIVGSLCVTFGALLLSAPLGIGCAILLAEVAPPHLRRLLRPAVELLVGIPSVVYGLVGMLVIVPAVRHIGGMGFSVLAAVLVLTAMVLPTVIAISEDSLRAVPQGHKEASLALGATHWQTIRHVMLPSARSGIAAAVVLGMGRAIGETMAMIMVIGNAIGFPASPLDPARTLTGNIAVEIMYASGTQESALFATGIVLFIMILALNSIAFVIRGRK